MNVPTQFKTLNCFLSNSKMLKIRWHYNEMVYRVTDYYRYFTFRMCLLPFKQHYNYNSYIIKNCNRIMNRDNKIILNFSKWNNTNPGILNNDHENLIHFSYIMTPTSENKIMIIKIWLILTHIIYQHHGCQIMIIKLDVLNFS